MKLSAVRTFQQIVCVDVISAIIIGCILCYLVEYFTDSHVIILVRLLKPIICCFVCANDLCLLTLHIHQILVVFNHHVIEPLVLPLEILLFGRYHSLAIDITLAQNS